MHIRASAWHLRVFAQAFVHDRRWLDGNSWDVSDFPDFPEKEAYRTFGEEYNAMPLEARDSETVNKLHSLEDAFWSAHSKLEEAASEKYSARKAEEVKERLHAGRMSLCPYFWSVVSAVVFYYGLVRSTRPIRQLIPRIAPALLTVFVVFMVGGLVSLIGYGIYENRDQVPTPSGIVASIKAEYREYKENKRQEAEHQARQLREQQAWERANPQEVALRRRQEEQNRLMEERRRAEERASNWQGFKDDLKDFALTGAILIAGLVGAVLALILGLYTILLLGEVFSFLARLLNPVIKVLSFKTVPETGFRAWIVRQSRRIASAWAAWRQFWKDTRELVAAFAKAKKERVCPYLTVTNGESTAR